MNTPSRQFPSVITFGESTRATTVRPPTSVPSTSPSATWKTSATRQKSRVEPSENEAVHGQITLHEQVSKYEPSSFQGMRDLLGQAIEDAPILHDGRRRGQPPRVLSEFRPRHCRAGCR